MVDSHPMEEAQKSVSTLRERDFETDARVLAARIDAYRGREPSHRRTPIDDEATLPPYPGRAAVPEIHASRLEVNILRSAIASRGALIVRGLFDATTMAYYKGVIDGVLDTCYVAPEERPTLDDPRAAFCNPPPNIETVIGKLELVHCRYFHRESGSAMTIESASVAEELLALYARKGLRELLTDYLGEPPCLSVQKWVLRRIGLPAPKASWHQDGAFMGPHINSLNMWVALDECGGTTGSPGMDVLPKRLKGLVDPGADGAAFKWSVSDGLVDDSEVKSPVFRPGDAFFFDHFYLHRTQRGEFARPRYAIETWFFGAGNFSKEQVPLEW
jgi:hypothetical protein